MKDCELNIYIITLWGSAGVLAMCQLLIVELQFHGELILCTFMFFTATSTEFQTTLIISLNTKSDWVIIQHVGIATVTEKLCHMGGGEVISWRAF